MQYAIEVHIAAKVLSHSVAAYILTLISEGNIYYIDHLISFYYFFSTGHLNPQSIPSACSIKEVDNLFNSFNGKADEGLCVKS